MNNLAPLLMELDQLKSVYRQSYIADGQRKENTAEHSWHLATTLMALKPMLPIELNIDKAIKMALVHDVCEIGAGDIGVYEQGRQNIATDEENYLADLQAKYPSFGGEVYDAWREYEAQETIESQWVKVLDKLLPFLLNVATEGRLWREANITRTMVIKNNACIKETSPEIYEWMLTEIDKAEAYNWFSQA